MASALECLELSERLLARKRTARTTNQLEHGYIRLVFIKIIFLPVRGEFATRQHRAVIAHSENLRVVVCECVFFTTENE